MSDAIENAKRSLSEQRFAAGDVEEGSWLARERERNMQHKRLFSRLCKIAFGDCTVLVAHHVTYQHDDGAGDEGDGKQQKEEAAEGDAGRNADERVLRIADDGGRGAGVGCHGLGRQIGDGVDAKKPAGTDQDGCEEEDDGVVEQEGAENGGAEDNHHQEPHGRGAHAQQALGHEGDEPLALQGRHDQHHAQHNRHLASPQRPSRRPAAKRTVDQHDQQQEEQQHARRQEAANQVCIHQHKVVERREEIDEDNPQQAEAYAAPIDRGSGTLR